MSIYDITGWSGGGRRPISHNLRAGQFRGLGSVNVFGTPTRTVINNNFGGGYNYGYYDDCGSSTPKWVDWCMGGGMVMNFLGQMMQAIFPHRGGIDGRGSARGEMTDNQKQDLAMYTDVLKNAGYKVSGPSSTGEFILTDVTSKKSQKFENFETLKDYIDNNLVENDDAEPPATELTAEGKLQAQLETAKESLNTFNAEDITAEIKDGKIKYKYGDKYYDNLKDAVEAKNNASKSAPKTVTQESQVTGAKTYRVNKGETWYEIVLKYNTGKSVYQAIGELKNLNKVTDRTAVIGPNEKADSEGNIQIPPDWKLKD